MLAAIVRNIAVPGSELGIATPPAPESVVGAQPGTVIVAPATTPPPEPSPAPEIRPAPAAKVETARPEPKWPDPAKAEAKKSEPPKPEPKKSEATKADSKKPTSKTAGAAADKPAKKAEPKKAAEPPRWWVQVAGGANVADLPKSWDALAGKSALLKGRQAWTTPLRFTNRLLTGPFKTGAEAQAFVNKLGGAGLSAFTFESEVGQKVTRLPAR